MADATKSKQDDTMLAALATLPLVGLIIYFAMADASAYVKNYAKQSMGLLAIWLVAVVLGFIPILGWILSCVLGIVGLVAWLMLLINALQGNQTFKLPVLGDLVDGILKN
jgi:uncharacterized membrane protein